MISFCFRKVWPRDKVVIHQIGRGPYAPSLSPFPLKLETYCRMAKIPHMVSYVVLKMKNQFDTSMWAQVHLNNIYLRIPAIHGAKTTKNQTPLARLAQ